MNIVGERIVLRAIEERDCEMLLELINDPETEMMIGGFSFPVSSSEQKKWVNDQYGNKDNLRCVIADKTNQEKGLGTIILTDIDYKNGLAQVHVKMGKRDGRGNGFGSDALNTLTRYAFEELRLNCIYADVLSYNIVSQKLFERCGFKKDGLLRSRIYKKGAFRDVISYSLLKDDLKENV